LRPLKKTGLRTIVNHAAKVNDEAKAAEPKKRVGRPQNPERGDAILAVTLDIHGERGFAGLTDG
jgi:hypothetical protein